MNKKESKIKPGEFKMIESNTLICRLLRWASVWDKRRDEKYKLTLPSGKKVTMTEPLFMEKNEEHKLTVADVVKAVTEINDCANECNKEKQLLFLSLIKTLIGTDDIKKCEKIEKELKARGMPRKIMIGAKVNYMVGISLQNFCDVEIVETLIDENSILLVWDSLSTFEDNVYPTLDEKDFFHKEIAFGSILSRNISDEIIFKNNIS